MRRAAIVVLAVLVVAPGATAAAGFKKRLPPPVEDDDFREEYDDPDKAALGQLLFFDKMLSGNRNISCASCHHPMAATSDGLSMSVGEGPRGLGVTRSLGEGLDAVPERVPRNAPALFNIGAVRFRRLFHDGRVEEDVTQPSGFRTPAGDAFPRGIETVLAAQAMFPVTSTTEMAGQAGENPIGDAAAAGRLAGPGGVWEQLAERIRTIPEYVDGFTEVFAAVNGPDDITFPMAANAIAAFAGSVWRADDSPFDRHLRGDKKAMSKHALKGMKLFYGKAGCHECHAGSVQTDHDFHAVAMPQIGPGKGDGPDGRDDYGRERVTGDPADRYRFRTPSLRQVAITAPYGHAGAYDSLEAVVRHQLDPAAGITTYDPTQAVLPSRADLDALDFVVQNDPERVAAIAAANEIEPRALSDKDVHRLVEFLHALTDRRQADLRRDVPRSVPSGLPVFD
jgi:cytochrome c peroxidase